MKQSLREVQMEAYGLIQLIVPIAIASIVIGFTKSQIRYGRMDYFTRIIGVLIGATIASFLIFMTESPSLLVVAAIAGILAGIISWHWAVLRTNDIGWNKWINLVGVIPAIGMVYFIALFFIPGKPIREETASDDPFDS